MPRTLLLVLLAVSFLLLAAPQPTRGDVPTVMDNGNASRTVVWNMTDASGLSVDPNVSMAGGNASLLWQNTSVTWSKASDFVANGTLPSQMTANASGIGLWANTSNYVADGNFSTAGPAWTYTNGSTGEVEAAWNTTLRAAQLDHVAGSTLEPWDSMDSNVQTNWVPFPASAAIVQNTSGMKQGSGMMGVDVVAWSGSYLSIINRSSETKSLNWSQEDRLVLWIRLNAPIAVGFNVTAVASGARAVGSSNQSLSQGWQELTVDLDQLGNASVRSSLGNVTLRFNGVGVPTGSWFNIDDVRLGKAKDFTERASVSQSFSKANGTTPLPGSAHLAFDWEVANATGVFSYSAVVGVSSGSNSYNVTLNPEGLDTWNHASVDVSPNTTGVGSYTVSFGLQVVANTTLPTNVTIFLDNVSLVFPGRDNATFRSNPLTMGYDSAYQQVSWTASIPADTTIVLGIRSGNNSNPNSAAWSAWQAFTTPETSPLAKLAGIYFQIEAQLGTTNASRTPVLLTLEILTGHHRSDGSVASNVYPALGDFLAWGTFNSTIYTPPLTSVVFSVFNGSVWVPVVPGASLSFIRVAQIQWRASLSSSDLLVSPSIRDVRITYEYTGRPVRIQVFHDAHPLESGETLNVSLGQYSQFTATVYDAGSHVLPSVLAPLIWQSNDTRGTLAQNGSYLPGDLGLHWINVTVSGYQVYASIRVYVTGALSPSGGGFWDLWPAYVVAIAAALGFAVYELVIRRMFAIDDVFLIAKDGRLILHNTRRMRADRDEDILSGMLTAIMAFLRDQDPEENGELRSFEVGGKTTLLERGQHVYLTAVYSGRVPRWAGKDLHRFMVDLESRFGDAFAHWSGSPEDLHGLKDYMGRFVSHVRYHVDRSAAEAAV